VGAPRYGIGKAIRYAVGNPILEMVGHTAGTGEQAFQVPGHGLHRSVLASVSWRVSVDTVDAL